MPTYKNNGDSRVFINNYSIEPEETKYVPYYSSHSDLELISEVPYYNPVVARTTITFSEAETQTHELDDDTKSIMISDVSGITVDVYIQDETNTPATMILPEGYANIIDVEDKFTQVILESDDAGSCIITEYNTEIKLQ